MRLQVFSTLAIATAMLLSALSVFSPDAGADQGSADSSGYRWIDSNSPGPSVPFSWIEISVTGTELPLAGDDNWVGPYAIGFDFEFYGNKYSEFFVSTNGLVTFGEGTWEYYNWPIPMLSPPNDYIAPYWDDLCVDYGGYNDGAVYYELIGSPPNQQLVIEWWKISELYTYGLLLTFEAILNETGEVWFQYYELSGMDGWDATVGIENADGSDGCQYSYASPVLHDSLAIMISLGLIGFGPDGKMYGEVGWAVPHALKLTNHQSFADSFDIAYSSDLGWLTSLYDGSMIPLTDTNGNGIPDTGDVAPDGTFEMIVTVEIPISPQGVETTYLVASSFADAAHSDDAKLVTALKPAQFVPPHGDFLGDSDSDGLANTLNIEVRFNVSTDALYVLDSVLYDSNMTLIFGFQLTDYYTPGLCTAYLWFESIPIWLNGMDGPFIVEIGLLDTDFAVIEQCTYVTSAYTLDQFDPPSGRFVLPIDEFGADTDGDGLYNELVLNATINVTQAVEFVANACLYDSQRLQLLEVSLWTYLDVGLQNLLVAFDARAIFREGVNGPYTYNLALYDVTSGFFWNDEHENLTAPYTYDQFDPTEVLFEPPYTEYGLDDDGDGMYNFLVINVTLNSSVSGTFYLGCDLYTQTRELMMSWSSYLYLDVGVNIIEVSFDGRTIWDYKTDGPYPYELVLTGDGFLLDEDEGETFAYSYSQFQSPPAFFNPPHVSVPVDEDGDGLYDYVSVNVSLTVLVNGTYLVFGLFFDGEYHTVWGNWVRVYLEMGNRYVELRCQGFEMYLSGFCGEFGVELSVQDVVSWYGDYGIYTIGYYNFSDFVRVPGTMRSKWADLAPTIDGVYSSSEWAGAAVANLREADPNNALDVLLLAMNNETHLFLCYDALGDRTMSPDDHAAIAFDTSNDENVSQDGEDQFIIGSGVSTGQVHYTFDMDACSWVVDCAPFIDSLPDHQGLAGAYGFGASDNNGSEHRIYEFCIPLVLIEAVPGDTLGLSGAAFGCYPGVYDGAIAYWSSWPRSYPDTWRFSWYGDLVLAQPPPVTMAEISGTLGLNDWYVSAVNVTLTATGGHGGVKQTLFRLDGGQWESYDSPVAVSADGAHVLEYYSVDNANNLEVAKSLSFKLDLTDPVTTSSFDGTSGSNGWYVSSVTVSLAADDGMGSGLGSTFYRIDNGQWEAYSEPFTMIAEGTNAVEYYSVDVAGNDETAKSSTVKIDKSAPTATHALFGTLGPGDWYISQVTFTLTASDPSPGSGVAAIEYRLDGGDWLKYTYPVLLLESGTRTLEYRSADVAGNQESVSSASFKMDLEAPKTTAEIFGTQGDNGWYTSVVALSLTAVDNVEGAGVARTMYRIGLGIWQTYSAEISMSEEGEHTVSFYTVDMAGNEEGTQATTFKLDRTSPMTSASVSEATVTLAGSDAVSGVSRTMYRVDGSAWQDYLTAFTVSGKGNHTIEYYSVDNAGNIEPVKTAWVEVPLKGLGLSGTQIGAVLGAAAVIVALAFALFWKRRRERLSAGEKGTQETKE